MYYYILKLTGQNIIIQKKELIKKVNENRIQQNRGRIENIYKIN